MSALAPDNGHQATAAACPFRAQKQKSPSSAKPFCRLCGHPQIE